MERMQVADVGCRAGLEGGVSASASHAVHGSGHVASALRIWSGCAKW